MLIVNGTDVSHCLGFGWDGCHKIYLVENEAELEQAERAGYTPLEPMEKLESVFMRSCPLRFIYWWDLDKPRIVPQCASRVTFEDENGKRVHILK